MNQPIYVCPACGEPDHLANRVVLDGLVRGTVTHTPSGPTFNGNDETEIDWDHTPSQGLACLQCGWTSSSTTETGATSELAVDPPAPRTIDAFQNLVAIALTHRGIEAEGYHSGGGICGIQVTTGPLTMFSTLQAEDRAWLDFDINTDNGYLASLIVQVRPYNYQTAAVYTTAGHAAAVADEITRVTTALAAPQDP